MARRKGDRSACRRVVEAVNGLATSRDAGRSDDAIAHASRRLKLTKCGERERKELRGRLDIERLKRSLPSILSSNLVDF